MKNSIGKDTIVLTSAKMVTIFSSLIVMMFLSRYTTLEEYGTYNQIILIITLASSLLMLGFPNSINYFMAKAESKKERDYFLNTYYTFTTMASLLVGVSLLFLTPYIEVFFENNQISKYFLILLLLPWCRSNNSSIEKVLVVNNEIKKLQIFKGLHAIALISAVALAAVLKFNLSGILILILLIETIFSLVVYYFIFKITRRFRPVWNIATIKKILVFSLPIGIASMVGTLNIQLDKLMIGRYFSTETLAIYFNASKEIPINVIAGALTAIVLPKLVRLVKEREIKKAISLWGNSIITSYYIIIYFVIIFVLFSSEILILLYSEKFESGAAVFSIYSLTLLLKATYFGMILSSSGKTKTILYSSVISLLANVILNFLFINSFGIIGPAISTLITTALMNFTQLYLSSKLINVKLSDIFPWSNLIKITIMSLIIYFIGMFLKYTLIQMGYFEESLILFIVSPILLGIYILISKRSFIENWNMMNKKGSMIKSKF